MKEKFDPITDADREARKRLKALPSEERAKAIEMLHERALGENVSTFYERANIETDETQRELIRLTLSIAEKVRDAGGMSLVVGGYVRDEVLKRYGYDLKPKDIDLEVYGLDPQTLKELLQQFGEIDVVGESFGVIKIGGLDVSVPRRDSKAGRGHKGFTVEGDPEMSVVEAARRRDFTINAMGLDPLTGEIIDKFGGLEDVRDKVLRAVDPETFADDPLRVLRTMQFAARFNFTIDKETVRLCRGIDISELPRERVGEEWKKMLQRSECPSIGLKVAQELGVLEKLHPELEALLNTPQDKEWHPEGDVFVHTGLAIDTAARICRRGDLVGDDALTIILATLCHDLGKPATTAKNAEGRITAHGHAEAGLMPAKKFLEDIFVPRSIAEKVLPLVHEHTFMMSITELTDVAVRRLAKRLYPATIKELALLIEADLRGRGTELAGCPDSERLLAAAERLALDSAQPLPLVMGRDLLALGFKPGKELGNILQSVFDAQLDGLIADKEAGLQMAGSLLEK